MSIVKDIRERHISDTFESVEWLKKFSDDREYQHHFYNLIIYAFLTDELYQSEKYKRQHFIKDLDARANEGV